MTATGGRAEECCDLVVIGGGVQGLTVALEAARRGLRPVLLERGRLGSATSANWFRILHGGLRYLQNLDLRRAAESQADRRWFLAEFPDEVRPAPFLMPLYGRGLKRPTAFRTAFVADALLGLGRNRGLAPESRVPRGRVLDAGEVARLWPGVPRAGLRGGALWHDAVAPDAPALIVALAARARAAGAVLRERAEAEALTVDGKGRVTGVAARGPEGLRVWQSPMVVNAAGPWADALAARLGAALPALPPPVLGFNLRLDRAFPGATALAVSPPGSDGPMLFLQPDGGRTLAGTWYAPWNRGPDRPAPGEAEIAAFLAALDAAVPGLDARRGAVVEVLPGLLPGVAPEGTELLARDILCDHGARGGPAGFYSACCTKFTSARRNARRLLDRVPLPPGSAGRKGNSAE